MRFFIYAGIVLYLSLPPLAARAQEAVNIVLPDQDDRVVYGQIASDGYPFFKSELTLSAAISRGILTKLYDGYEYEIASSVDWPYVDPYLGLYVERLASLFSTCGETLVIEEALQLVSEVDDEDSTISVHPTGLAIDFTIPITEVCQTHLRSLLKDGVESGLVSASEVSEPHHFHVVLYKRNYRVFLESRPEEWLVPP